MHPSARRVSRHIGLHGRSHRRCRQDHCGSPEPGKTPVTVHRSEPWQPPLPWPTDDGAERPLSARRDDVVIFRKWHTVGEVATMLGYGLTKTKMLIITGELRSLKDGRSRRVLPEWVDEYVARKAAESQELDS